MWFRREVAPGHTPTSFSSDAPMTVSHTENAFETAIEHSLISAGGYRQGDPAEFSATLALTPSLILEFLRDSQPKEWTRLEAIHGATAAAKAVALIAKELDNRGTLDVLRHGVVDHGVKLRLAFFKPATTLNPEAQALYDKNILTITRQVHHSVVNPALSIDVVLSVNGLPVATGELKTPFTNQTVEHAKWQYRNDRNPNDPLLRFKTRCLVHFAVDPDLVFMTTKLAGKSTYFLPFNKGRNKGAGNPDNPSGYKTALPVGGHLGPRIAGSTSSPASSTSSGRLTETEGSKRGIIFPRYHQLDAVSKVLADVRAKGVGQNYLIEHSAGSGKSNSIAWLAHPAVQSPRRCGSSHLLLGDRHH